jgi:hypothetical protein
MLNLRHGIVRVRDAGDPDGSAIPAALAVIASGALPGPDLYYAYAFVGDGHARWGNTLRLERPDQAADVIAGLVSVGATWVKAYENLDRPRIEALIGAAREAGLQVMGHVPTTMAMEEALLPDSQHLFGVPDPTTLRRDHVLNRAIDWTSVTPQRIDAVVEACVRHGLAMTPTLSTSANLIRLKDWEHQRKSADVALLPEVYPRVIWHPHHGLPAYRGMTSDDFERARDAYGRKLSLVRALADAGVDLRLGTDTQQPFVVPGAALHAEMAAFETAGVARQSAWQIASSGAAKVLGIVDAERIVEGARADLVVSPRSPFEADWQPYEISATIIQGECVLADDLDGGITRELARFEGMVASHVTRWLARFALDRTAKHFVG